MPKFYSYDLTPKGKKTISGLIERYGEPGMSYHTSYRKGGPWKIGYSKTFDLYRPSIAALLIIQESSTWAKPISIRGIQENRLLQDIESMGPANLEEEPSPEEALELLQARGLIIKIAGPNVSASEGTVIF